MSRLLPYDREPPAGDWLHGAAAACLLTFDIDAPPLKLTPEAEREDDRGLAALHRGRGARGFRPSFWQLTEAGRQAVLTAHPFVSGRPSRVEAIERFVAFARACGDVRLDRADRVADAVLGR